MLESLRSLNDIHANHIRKLKEEIKKLQQERIKMIEVMFKKEA